MIAVKEPKLLFREHYYVTKKSRLLRSRLTQFLFVCFFFSDSIFIVVFNLLDCISKNSKSLFSILKRQKQHLINDS